MWRFWKLLLGKYSVLPCWCEGGNVHDALVYDPYTVVIVENNDIPIDTDAPTLNEIFTVKTFCEFFRNRKIYESFNLQKIPANTVLCSLRNIPQHRCCVKIKNNNMVEKRKTTMKLKNRTHNALLACEDFLV